MYKCQKCHRNLDNFFQFTLMAIQPVHIPPEKRTNDDETVNEDRVYFIHVPVCYVCEHDIISGEEPFEPESERCDNICSLLRRYYALYFPGDYPHPEQQQQKSRDFFPAFLGGVGPCLPRGKE